MEQGAGMTAHEEKVAVVQDFIKETMHNGMTLESLPPFHLEMVARGLVAQLEEIDRKRPKPGPVMRGGVKLPSSEGHPDTNRHYGIGDVD